MLTALQSRLGEEGIQKLLSYVNERKREQASARDQMFQEKFDRYGRMANSDFAFRASGPTPLVSTIFDKKNESVEIVANIAGFVLSRLFKDLFGSDPWFSATPQGPHDAALAGEIQKHGGYKLKQARWVEAARDVLKTALDLSYVATKTTWRIDREWHEEEKLVLCNQQGEPIIAPDGDYIYPDDQTTATAQEEQPAETGEMGENGYAPAGEAQQMGPTFLRAPDIESPNETNGYKWLEQYVEEQPVLYAGLDFFPMHWQDVTWDLNAAKCSLSDPQCTVITCTGDMSYSEMCAKFDPTGKDADMQSKLAQLMTGDSNPKAEAGKEKKELREAHQHRTDPDNPVWKVTEAYFRKVVVPGKPESRVYMVYVEDLNLEIYTDYLNAIMPRAEAPINVVAINKIPGRAYGRGLYEVYEMAASLIDKLTNGVLLRNEYNNDPYKFLDARADLAGIKTGKPVPKTSDGWIIVDGKGLPISQVCHILSLPDLDSRTMELVEMFRQIIQVRSGVTDAAQGDMTDLPANNTASGVNSLTESASVIHQFTLEEVKSGLTPPLRTGMELIYFKQDADETYEYLEGDTVGGVMTLTNAQMLAKLPLNVEILLSRARNQEQRESALAAIPQHHAFFTLPPAEQRYARPLYVQVFSGLQINNPDSFFPTAAEIEAAIQQQAQGQQQPVSERIQLSYKDAPDPIRRQIEQAMGLQPMTPEQEQQEAAKAQAEAAPSPFHAVAKEEAA